MVTWNERGKSPQAALCFRFRDLVQLPELCLIDPGPCVEPSYPPADHLGMWTCVSLRWCSRSLNISLWIGGDSFCSPSLCSTSRSWGPGKQLVLLLKTETQKALSTLDFSSFFVTLFPPASSKGGRLSLALHLLLRCL